MTLAELGLILFVVAVVIGTYILIRMTRNAKATTSEEEDTEDPDSDTQEEEDLAVLD
jgi:hypothetical protein